MAERRKYTNLVIENGEEGLFTWEQIARACLGYMSEHDVEDMATAEGLVVEDEEEDTDEDDQDE